MVASIAPGFGLFWLVPFPIVHFRPMDLATVAKVPWPPDMLLLLWGRTTQIHGFMGKEEDNKKEEEENGRNGIRGGRCGWEWGGGRANPIVAPLFPVAPILAGRRRRSFYFHTAF
jgi:hypothetical protein